MDDIKLFAKNEKELETPRQAVRVYNQNIGIEFGMEKMRHANNKKRGTTHDGRNGTNKSRKK